MPSAMIVQGKAGAIARAINKQVENHPLAHDVSLVSVFGEYLTVVLESSRSHASYTASGTLLHVQVAMGDVSDMEAKLNILMDNDSYLRPLWVGQVAAGTTKEKELTKTVALLGKFQP